MTCCHELPNTCALKLALGDEITAYNLQFRCGPCDICGGDCLCLSDDLLIERLKTGLKPVGTFPRKTSKQAILLEERLNAEGLTTWLAKNKWGMYIVVACKHPDVTIPMIGTPRNRAFTMDFINENLSYVEIGALFGYPKNLSRELDNYSDKTTTASADQQVEGTDGQEEGYRRPHPGIDFPRMPCV